MIQKDYFILNQKLANQNPHSQKLNFQQGEVIFPYQNMPDSQLEYMKHVMKILNQRKSIVLESATGSGKTISLLTTCCAFAQKKYQEKGQPIKIIYLSKTHSQLSQIQKELEKTCYRPNMLMFGAKKNLCINQKIQNLFKKQEYKSYTDWDGKCEEAIKQKRQKIQLIKDGVQQKKYSRDLACEYYSDFHPVKQAKIFDLLKHQCLNNQKIKDLGREHKFCPALYPKRTKNWGTLYLMPYIYFTNQIMLPYYKDLIQNSIIIFDEGHNVIKTASQGSDIQLDSNFFKQVYENVLNFKMNKKNFSASKIQEEQNWRWLQNLQEQQQKVNLQQTGDYDVKTRTLLNILKHMMNYSQKSMLQKFQTFKQSCALRLRNAVLPKDKKYYDKQQFHFRGKEEIANQIFQMLFLQMKQNQFKQCSLNNESLEQILKGILQLTQQVLLYIKSYGKYAYKLEAFKSYLQKILLIIKDSQVARKYYITWYLQWHFKQAKKCSYGNLMIKCLSAQFIFQKIMSFKPNSIIITSGTLSPLQLWPQQLKMQIETHHVKCQMGQDRVKINALTLFNQIGQFQTNHDQKKTILNYFITKILNKIVAQVPNGIIVVLRSKTEVKNVKQILQKNITQYQCLKKLKRQVIFEEEQNYQANMLAYKDAAQTEEGALLFCYFNGKISQGIDLPDQLCRGVIIYGIPNLPPFDSFVVQKKLLINQQKMTFQGKQFTDNMWYQIQAAKAINQAAGRLIRHEYDYGTIFLIDSRYEQYYQGDKQASRTIIFNLSSWIKKNMKIRRKQIDSQLQIELSQFFATKKKQLGIRAEILEKQRQLKILKQKQSQQQKVIKVKQGQEQLAEELQTKLILNEKKEETQARILNENSNQCQEIKKQQQLVEKLSIMNLKEQSWNTSFKSIVSQQTSFQSIASQQKQVVHSKEQSKFQQKKEKDTHQKYLQKVQKAELKSPLQQEKKYDSLDEGTRTSTCNKSSTAKQSTNKIQIKQEKINKQI